MSGIPTPIELPTAPDEVFATLDAMQFDAALLPVFEDVRPLRGVAAFLDWREREWLSRILLDRSFAGEEGTTLLTPARRSGYVQRVVLFGVGMRATWDEDAASRFIDRALEVAARLSGGPSLLELPRVGDSEEREARFSWLDAYVSESTYVRSKSVAPPQVIVSGF
ncbi:MAG: M17 family peptidase N-terminal domain-containing protein [Nannocystaceae bacterium]